MTMSNSIEAIREALAVAQGILNDPSSTSTHLFQAHESFRETATLLAIAELLAELDAALSRASEVEADAARYRWLKHAARSVDWSAWIRLRKHEKHQAYRVCTRITPDDMDDEIDAAIRSMRPTGDSGVQS